MSDPGFEPTQANMPPVPPPVPGAATPPAGQPPVDPTYGGPGGPGGPGDVPPGGPPPEEPSDKRPWIIGGLIAAIALIALVLFLLNRGDDGDEDVSLDTVPEVSTTTSSSTTSSTSTSTTSTSTTTTPPETTTTAAPPVTVDPNLCAADGTDAADPATPAQTVMAAWIRGDELCAAELMTPAARTSLFSRDGEDADESFQGCFDGTEPETTDCAFTHPGGSTHFVMNFGAGDGWTVFEVNQVAD